MRHILKFTSALVALSNLLHVKTIHTAIASTQSAVAKAARKVTRYSGLIQQNNDLITDINNDTLKLIQEQTLETDRYIATFNDANKAIRALEAEALLHTKVAQ